MLAKIQAMKAQIVIYMSEDGKRCHTEVKGSMTDVSTLLLTSIDHKPEFAAAVLIAVETYIRRDENKENPLVAAFNTNRKTNYHA